MFLQRRMLMAMGMEDEEVKVKKYTYTPQTSKNIIKIPLDFEPGTVILYDNYPNDYYTENGTINYESNLSLPVLIKDGKYDFAVTPYSASGVNVSYDESKFTVSYDSGTLEINTKNLYKSLYAGHTYTIIVIGKIESEYLE